MDFLSVVLLGVLVKIIGFGIGLTIGLAVGYFLFIYSMPIGVEDPVVRPLLDMTLTEIEELLPEIPLWVKNPDYARVDWLNKTVMYMWPYLDKVIDANDREVILEVAFKWASRSNIVLELHIFSLRIQIHLVDLQVSSAARVSLKHLTPTFPCFSTVVVSLMDKPQVDFGILLLGVDIMSIPILHSFIQEIIQNKIAKLYPWPHTHEIPVLDVPIVPNKPVGLLRVKIMRGIKLLRMDYFGQSDHYIKLNLNGERLEAKKTTVQKKTINPVWNEYFRLSVKDPQSQILDLTVYDLDKVGRHYVVGVQAVPLNLLTPFQKKRFTLDVLRHKSGSEHQPRGQIELHLTYEPFRGDSGEVNGSLDGSARIESGIKYAPFRGDSGEVNGSLDGSARIESGIDSLSDPRSPVSTGSPTGAGLLLVTVHKAVNVEGEHHQNPYAIVLFRGEPKKTKMVRNNRYPVWDENFHFLLEEPPVNDWIHIKVMSKPTGIVPWPKENLGYVEIKLDGVVLNRRICNKYNLVQSKRGRIHIELEWKIT